MMGRPRIYSDAERVVRRKESQRLRDARDAAKMTDEQKARAREIDRSYYARCGPRTAEQKRSDVATQQRYRERVKADPQKHAKHKARVASYNKAYVLSPEQSAKLNARSRDWYAKNKERKATAQAKWNAANPEAARLYAHKRRALKRQRGGGFSRDIVARLIGLQGGRCAVCSRKFSASLSYEIDHITPLALGGRDVDENAQLLCRKCNRQKHAKDPIQFMQERGFLL